MRKAFNDYIGVFDSGVGGISVLRHLTEQLPNENFLFYGDSANAPYGEKSVEQVRALAFDIVRRLVEGGVKAIVIACNTATSAAARELRRAFELPIIGVEPALKPAATASGRHRVLVMATPVTLSLQKYRDLWNRYAGYAECISCSCPGLAERIEHGRLDAPDLTDLLEKLIGRYRGRVDSVVLGCTHYPFVGHQIRSVLGGQVTLYDGGAGTAGELKNVLTQKQLLTRADTPGGILFQSSLKRPSEIALYRHFYHLDL
jgi:glutamate racemase